MSNPQSFMFRLGILGRASNPSRLVTFSRTYVHPETNQSVTLQPVARIARPQFWREAYYNLHRKYDRVLFQDGRQPFLAPSDPVREWLRRVFPIIDHREYLSNEELQQYIGSKEVNDQESSMALTSVMKDFDPPVDPRGRKAIELLLTIDPQLRVVMPWSVVHMPYLMWKLRSLGYVEKSAFETTVTARHEAFIIASVMVFFMFILPLYVIFKTIGLA